MRALRILLRHRITSWLRDPSWGTGTVAGHIVLLGLLLFLLAPLGLGSYVLGDVLRELYPETDALRLINGGVLYLVPAFMASRFLSVGACGAVRIPPHLENRPPQRASSIVPAVAPYGVCDRAGGSCVGGGDCDGVVAGGGGGVARHGAAADGGAGEPRGQSLASTAGTAAVGICGRAEWHCAVFCGRCDAGAGSFPYPLSRFVWPTGCRTWSWQGAS